MDQTAREMLARRAGLELLRGLNDIARNLPHPDGKTLRVTVAVIDSSEDLGSVDVDTTNASDLGFIASRRDGSVFETAPTPAPVLTGKPTLRLVGGA